MTHEAQAIVAIHVLKTLFFAVVAKLVQNEPIFVVGFLFPLGRSHVFEVFFDGFGYESLAGVAGLRTPRIGHQTLCFVDTKMDTKPLSY